MSVAPKLSRALKASPVNLTLALLWCGLVGSDTEPIGTVDAEDMLKDELEITEGWGSHLIK